MKNFRAQLMGSDQVDQLMPVLFIGHGSPMNGIEWNMFSEQWQKIGKSIPTPTTILVVSAHWQTRGIRVTAMEAPRTIHDFYGFPPALYEVQYSAPGAPQMALDTASLLYPEQVGLDHEWGLDHGSWTVLRHLFPNADIPVFQMSLDVNKSPSEHVQLAAELKALRRKGVLIVGSGNMVHNLRMVDFSKLNEQFGFDWALHMNELFKNLLLEGNLSALAQYQRLGQEAMLAIPTEEHFLPLLYAAALRDPADKVRFFNDYAVAGSLTMTSVWYDPTSDGIFK